MLEFRRLSKQSYWGTLKKTDKDDVMVGDYCVEGGCEWEFGLVEYDLGGNKTGVQIEMFDDAVKCLKKKKVVKALVEMEECNTLDRAEEILRRNGFEEAID